MKFKLSFILLCFTMLSFSCSSDDSNDDSQMMDPTQEGHFTLRVNGNGYDDELFVFNRDTISGSSNNILFLASSRNFTDYIAFRLPTIDEGTNTIIPYVNGDINTCSFVIQDDGIYLSEDGTITITESIGEYSFGGCYQLKGSMNINFRRQDNTPGTINVSGTFDLPSVGCMADN